MDYDAAALRTPDLMRTFPYRLRIAGAVLALAAFCVSATPLGAAPQALRLAPSKTWVGIARVYLEVDDLELSGRELRGRYRIRVPLRPSENDEGVINLGKLDSVDGIRSAGGTLVGAARSLYGKVHTLSCRVLPGGEVEIDVVSEDRKLSFETRILPTDLL